MGTLRGDGGDLNPTCLQIYLNFLLRSGGMQKYLSRVLLFCPKILGRCSATDLTFEDGGLAMHYKLHGRVHMD